MRVTDYQLYEVGPRYQFLKIETSDGLVGWGEPVVEGRAGPVRSAVEEMMESVILGESPDPIERRWQEMYRGGFYRGGPVLMSAIAGIDQALWDIKGKSLGAPIHELLGGRARDRVRAYQHIPAGDDATPEAYATAAKEQVDRGFSALKTSIRYPYRRIDSPRAVQMQEDRIAAIREAVGDQIDVGIDFHGRVSKAMANRLMEVLAPYEPMFYEEPVLPEHSDEISRLAAKTAIPVATGERLFSRWDFKPVFEAGGVDIIQPDLSHAGGITEVHKIAAMAEAYDIALAPHCPLGPISLAACLQIDLCSPNALVQEQVIHLPDYEQIRSILRDPTALDIDEEGYFACLDDPGLGVELDEDALADHEENYTWRVPQLRLDDGGVAEW